MLLLEPGFVPAPVPYSRVAEFDLDTTTVPALPPVSDGPPPRSGVSDSVMSDFVGAFVDWMIAIVEYLFRGSR